MRGLLLRSLIVEVAEPAGVMLVSLAVTPDERLCDGQFIQRDGRVTAARRPVTAAITGVTAVWRPVGGCVTG